MVDNFHSSGESKMPEACPDCGTIWWREELRKIGHEFVHNMTCKNGHKFEYKG